MILLLTMMYNNYIRKATAYAELNRLSDRELQDIGISRCDIPTIAEGNYHA